MKVINNSMLLSFTEISRRYGFYILKLLIGVGLIIYLIQKISIQGLIESFYLIELKFMFLALVFGIINIYIQYIRWKILLNNEMHGINAYKIIQSLFIGFSAGTFTPARSGEYFLRKLPLKELNLGSVITLTFIDKMIFLLNIVFWGALVSFGMLIFYYKVDLMVTASLFIFFSSFFTALFLIIYSKRFYNYLKEIKDRFNFKLGFIKKLVEPLSELNNQIISKLILIGFVNLIVILIEFALIVKSFNGDVLFLSLIITSMMVYFTKTLIPSVTLGEIGIRESAAIYFFGLYGVSESIAFNSSMILFTINLLVPSVIGLFFLFKLKRIE